MRGGTDRLDLPPDVLRSVRALGQPGHDWMHQLPDLLCRLEAHWDVRMDAVLSGGSAALVMAAETLDGRPVVVKVALPDGLEGHSPFATEVRALELGQGRGFVDLLGVVPEHHALLLERLGSPLRSRGLAVEEIIDIVVDTLRPLWVAPPADHGVRSGLAQAEWLTEFITSNWQRLGEPTPALTVQAATAAAAARAAMFDEGSAVLVHGDAHPSNVLATIDPAPGAPPFKLIDPDGMVSEPAHDLGVLLREWNDELAASPEPSRQLMAWCARAGARADVDPDAIWQWALVERVSTGLFLCALDDPAAGRSFLDVATRCAAARPS